MASTKPTARTGLLDRLEALIPQPECQATIPRLLFQTYATKDLPKPIRQNVQQLKDDNPGWDHTLYDDAAIEAFLTKEYGPDILAFYRSINPSYGAARADFFRYFIMYRFGGIYLDIKSRFLRPIDEVLRGDEQFVVSRWDNAPGQRYVGFGLHPELSAYSGGEIQQWHIIAVPGHPFLRAVILRMLEGIARYSPWRTGVAKTGVLRLTGPIAYTEAITPLLHEHGHRELGDHTEIALQYSFLPGEAHKALFSNHYTTADQPIIQSHGAARLSAEMFVQCRRLRRANSAAIHAVRRRLARHPQLSA